jgi:hypothetical protein
MRMKNAILIVMCLAIPGSYEAGVIADPFHGRHWAADGIAIGTVTHVHEATIDVVVEEWIRDRTEESQGEVRVGRYSQPTCFPSPESYAVGTRYLLLMSQPYDDGGAGNPHWKIIWQLLLDGADICLDDESLPYRMHINDLCESLVTSKRFQDAIRSFENCFSLQDDPIRGSFPVAKTCSTETIDEWSARSPFHSLLAREFDRSLQKRKERGR